MSKKFVTNLFLTNLELENVSKWKQKVVNNSLSHLLLQPLWERLAKLVPITVAPNVLTLSGLVCTIQAYWVVSMHSQEHYLVTSILAACLMYAYFVLSALDQIHATNTKNLSAMTELFKHGCENIAIVFQILTFLTCVGVQHAETRWYIVQAGQLMWLCHHLLSFNRPDKTIVYRFLSGPGEVIHSSLFGILLHCVFGLDWMWQYYVQTIRFVERFVFVELGPAMPLALTVGKQAMSQVGIIGEDDSINEFVLWQKGVQMFHYVVWWFVVAQILLMDTKHTRTRVGLLWCLLMRVVPAIIMEWTTKGITAEQTLSDALFLSIVILDIIVAKIADRELHNIVVVLSMASVLSNFIIYASLFMYFTVLLSDVCSSMNIPLLSPVINVYCDGVFDMLHLGHMNQFRQAMEVSGGTRLFVGVHTDDACADYKRRPIMNEQERYAAVRACKYVYEVIEGAPMVATAEHIDKHQLHIYAIGEEYYCNPDDHYYKVPRELGMLRPTKRSHGVSTSDIIARIQVQRPELLERKSEAAAVPSDGPSAKKQRIG